MKIIDLRIIISAVFILRLSAVYSQADVLTQHNDLYRTGWNNQETILNTSNVNKNTFGLLYMRSVDDQIYAQPLVVSNVAIGGGTHNIVIIATLNNTVYAFDADSGSPPAYWQINYTPSGYRPAVKGDMHPGLCGGSYNDFSGNIGIVGTPVIDKATNTLYFVTKIVNTAAGVEDNHAWNSSVTKEEYTYTTAGFYQQLHAVDLSTGAEKFNGPINITASVIGNGDGNDGSAGSAGGIITFDPRRQFNRGGLVLSKGIIYITFAAHCDWNPSHGWLIGYDASTLALKIAYNATPNDGRGGIWMSGAAPAVDSSGSIYFTTGNAYDGENGITDDPANQVNRGESVVKLTPNAPDNTATALGISSFFTPYNYQYLNDADLDFPIQTLLIPNTNLLLTGCKNDSLYLLDRTNLGGFNTSSNNTRQSINIGSNAQMHSSLAYFGGASNQYVYQFSENTSLQSFKVGTTSLSTPVTNNTMLGATGVSGAYMSVSSNGPDPSSALLWIYHAVNGCNANQQICSGILHAVRADDVTTELWNSNMNAVDNPGNFAKMNCPTIANGKVYISTFSNHVAVYGLTTNVSRCATNVALNKTALASSIETSSFPADDAFDGNMNTRWSSAYSDPQWIYVDLGAEYDICQVIINWETALGKNFTIDVSDDASNWTTVQAFAGNTSNTNSVTGNFQGRYVRMYGTARGTTYGYSIYEMQVFGNLAPVCGAPTNLNAVNNADNSETLSWNAVAGATSYIVQYKLSAVSSWITRTTTSTSVNISALSCNNLYNYHVQAVCASGTSTPAAATFQTGTTAVCASCGQLPTRYFSADIGDIGVAGSACYNPTLNNKTFTIQGSGNDIGGDSDQFQYAYTNLNGDEYVTARLFTQDGANAADKAGLMFRDSLSNTSPFAFVATTSGNGIIFEYRSVSGGPTTVITVSNVGAPYWLRLVKSGTLYTAYISPTGAVNSWIEIGSTVDLGFGASPVYVGMAVTSGNNGLLSTAVIDNYSESTSALPVKLINFTGSNINNQYTLLKWATSAEINSQYFDVERSKDGISFQSIARVNASDNSNVQQSYSATDYHPNNGINLYRLAETDNDGSISYSPIVSVSFGNQGTPQIFPNPANAYFMVIAGAEPVKKISILNIEGKTIENIVNDKGLSTIRISSASLASGIYIIEIKTASQVYNKKLFKK